MICGRCGRKLKDPVSIQIGYGPVCRGEMGIKAGPKKQGKARGSEGSSADYDAPLDIPGQMSIFDNPEWLPEEMKGGGYE